MIHVSDRFAQGFSQHASIRKLDMAKQAYPRYLQPDHKFRLQNDQKDLHELRLNFPGKVLKCFISKFSKQISWLFTDALLPTCNILLPCILSSTNLDIFRSLAPSR